MEERLFFIGLAMGAFAWLSKKFKETEALDTPTKAGLWHGLFCALSGFSVCLVLVMSIESRSKFEFAHGRQFHTGQAQPILLCSYHPSQQNTSTGRLTAQMLQDLMDHARSIIETNVETNIPTDGVATKLR